MKREDCRLHLNDGKWDFTVPFWRDFTCSIWTKISMGGVFIHGGGFRFITGGLVFSKNILIYVLDDFHSFFLRKLEGKTHLLDTLNICVGLMKNFLETFEKNFRAKNEDFHRIFESDLDAKFWMLKKTH